MWNETNSTGNPRDSFEGIKEEDEENFTDDLLSEHEEYIEVLENRIEQMRPLLHVIEKRESIISERIE